MSSMNPDFENEFKDGDAFEDMEIGIPENKPKSEFCPDGPVALVICKIEKGVAKSGAPKLMFHFTFAENAKKTHTEHLALNETSLYKLSQLICAIDPEQAALAAKSNGAFKAKVKKEFIGKVVMGMNKNDRKDDKVFMNITKWFRASDDVKKQFEGDLPF